MNLLSFFFFFFCNILYVQRVPLEVGDIAYDTVFGTAADTVYDILYNMFEIR